MYPSLDVDDINASPESRSFDRRRHDVADDQLTIAELFQFPSAADLRSAAKSFPGVDQDNRHRFSALSENPWRVSAAELGPTLDPSGRQLPPDMITRRMFSQSYTQWGTPVATEYSETSRGFKEGIFTQLLISPGAVKLRRRNDAKADETQRRLALRRELRKYLARDLPRPLTQTQAMTLDGWHDDELARICARPLTRSSAILLGEWEPDGFNKITRWSGKSRNNLRLTVSQLDLAPLLERGSPVMITYTVPGDWLSVTPTAAHASEIWNRYRTAWADEFGAPHSIWKREFQGRGAPHWHEWTVLPNPPAGWFPRRAGDISWSEHVAKRVSQLWTDSLRFGWDGSEFTCDGECENRRNAYFSENNVPLGRAVRQSESLDPRLGTTSPPPFLGVGWEVWDETPVPFARVIRCHSCHERAKSLRAGTNISYTKGAAARDPRRLATYFLKESLGGEAKAYQNWSPKEWAGQSVGRFWGVRGIEKAIEVIDIDPCDSYQLWRILRGVRQSHRRVARPEYNDQGWLLRIREGQKKIRVRSNAGHVLVNDGAKFARQLAEAMRLERVPDEAPSWQRSIQDRQADALGGVMPSSSSNYSRWRPPAKLRAELRLASRDPLTVLAASYTAPDWQRRKERNERRWQQRRERMFDSVPQPAS
jgi:hypothetical protein